MTVREQDVLARQLADRVGSPRGFERPGRFDLEDAEQARALRELLESSPGLVVEDRIVSQVAELLHARCPARKRDTRLDTQVAQAYMAERGGCTYGTWVHFPWRNALVRVLPEDEFVELRSARNQLLITPSEQRLLRERRVGVVGLSVGYAMAVTLALEGVGGFFRLADFDSLELSNTNRVGCGLMGLGRNKAVLAAQAMYEIDPFLDIQVFPEGITAKNQEAFFLEGEPLDVLIEECDDLPMKLRLRERARELRVPVLTETNQRGLLDVERYDREPDRPPFHGLLGDVTAEELNALSTHEKAPFLLRFMEGTEGMSSSFLASLLEVERSLAGWPQLASAVALGGAVVTDATRRVLLGQMQRSGRFRIDLETLVGDAARATRAPVRADPVRPNVRLCASPPSQSAGLERWVQAAALAPSGGNVQPWQFCELEDGSLACRLSPRGADSALDPDRMAARLACAAALVNLRLAAGEDGYRVEVDWAFERGDPGLLYVCRFHRDGSLAPDSLSPYVYQRCTNRRIPERRSLEAGSLAALKQEAALHGAAVIAHETETALAEVAGVLGELERIRVFSRPLYDEMMAELVDIPSAPTGIALETLELDSADEAAVEILRCREVVERLRAEGRGRALAEQTERQVRSASAVCLLHLPGGGSAAFLRGGMALQRLWLRATQLGLSVQPVSAGLYMLAQLRSRAAALGQDDVRALRAIEPAFRRCFPLPDGHSGVLLFRITRAEPPRARSARLPLETVFQREAQGRELRPAAIAT